MFKPHFLEVRKIWDRWPFSTGSNNNFWDLGSGIYSLFQLISTRFQEVNFLLWHPLIASLRWSVRARHRKKWTKHQKTWGKTPGKSLLNSSQIAFLLNCRFVDLYIHRTSYLVLQPRVLSKYSLECAEGSKSIHFQAVEVIGSLSVGLN